jgi:hypothetical protein
MPRLSQAELAADLRAADDAGLDTLLDAFAACVSIDAENDAVADRDTPVLED